MKSLFIRTVLSFFPLGRGSKAAGNDVSTFPVASALRARRFFP